MPHDAVPTDLLAELRNLHRRDPNLLDEHLPSLRLRPLSGARNNRVFAWDGPDGEVVLKLYRTDKRDHAACEYQALTHVTACGITAAPQPLWHDPDPRLPAIAMTTLNGEPVPELADPTAALRAVVAVLGQLRDIPLGPFADMPRVGSATNFMNRITQVWPGQLDEFPNESITAEMRSLLDAWQDRGDAEVLAEPAARVFFRGNSNLLNWLWNAPGIGVVDWEFVGYSDTAYDAAELVEHLSAHDVDDQVWISVLPDLGITDDASRRRFLAAQRTVALRWLSVLWKRRHKRANEFEYQATRVRKLLNNDFV